MLREWLVDSYYTGDAVVDCDEANMPWRSRVTSASLVYQFGLSVVPTKVL
jgi:hypothetical protein